MTDYRREKRPDRNLYKGFFLIPDSKGCVEVCQVTGFRNAVFHDRESAKQWIDGHASKRRMKKLKENPPVEIYSEIKEIIAKKGPGHKCDAACKRAGHTYRHKFSRKAGVYGHPDGHISIE
jgi:hypothetical protein